MQYGYILNIDIYLLSIDILFTKVITFMIMDNTFIKRRRSTVGLRPNKQARVVNSISIRNYVDIQ